MTNRIDEFESVNCPACQISSDIVWMKDEKPSRYVRCSSCGSIYASPRAPYASRYNWLEKTFSIGENAKEIAHSRQEALREEAEILFRETDKSRLLDIGCGLGDFFQWFAGPNWDCFGVEIVPAAAEFASQNSSAQVFTGTLRQAKFPEAYFDLVTMLDMIYYLDDPRADLLEVARILNPSGVLAIELTGLNYQILRGRGLLCWLFDRSWTRWQTNSSYLFWFSPIGLRKLLEGCGFHILQTQVIGSPTSTIAWRNSLSGAYKTLMDRVIQSSFTSLTWAPKYIVIAKLSNQ